MAVPLLDLSLQHQPLMPELRADFERIMASGNFILGPDVETFEKKLATYCGTSHAIGLTSGTDALLIAMMALGIGPGDEVIVPPFTFFGTAGCVARLGAKPVFVDVRESDFNLDPAPLERAITSRTKAVIPVHLFGQMADMDPILAITRRRGVAVIEDAAQSIGAEYRDAEAGSMGDVGCLSFYPSKNLSAPGDGGACVLNSDDLAQKIRVLRNQGMSPKYFHPVIGGNFRLDALKAAMLGVKLPHLNGWAQHRRANAARYTQELAGLPITLPAEQAGRHHVFNQYTIRVHGGRRDALREHLTKRKIGHDVYYPLPLHLQSCFAHLGHKAGDFPVSERLSKEVLSLPIFPELTAAQQDEVIAALREFFT